jgi:hypothetical protein
MNMIPQFGTGRSLPASFKREHLSAISRAAIALAIAGAASWSGAALAQVLAESTAQEAPAADPQQLCLGADSTVDQRVSGCTAMIESGKAQGRELAAAYAQRGFMLTIKRNLE